MGVAAAYARSRGSLVFMGTGNLDLLLATPDLASIIFVGGTDRNDARWVSSGDGSSWGPHVDLVAPADDIIVADPTLSTGYGRIDGTSFSTALVSGTAALAWAINPNLTPDEVEAMLLNTAVDIGTPGDDDFFGRGRLDAAAVAAAALATVPEPSAVALLIAGVGGVLIICCRRRKARNAVRAIECSAVRVVEYGTVRASLSIRVPCSTTLLRSTPV